MNEMIEAIAFYVAYAVSKTAYALEGPLLLQARIEAVYNTIVIIFLAVATAWFVRAARRWSELDLEWSQAFDRDIVMTAGSVVAIAVWAIIITVTIPNILTALFNPEYWALQEVLRALGQ